ncbi:MAG: 3-deoxy-manno-octulosonate cytidylyltransferase [Congregibacter sp.]
MSYVAVIPARYASSRLPGKPLADIAGKPMVQRVWERCCLSAADRVIVATDDQRIADACDAFGAEVAMTAADHPTGTDRLAEVVAALNLADDQVLVNVQGDEPLVPPAVVNQVAQNLSDCPEAAIATLCEPFRDAAQLHNPNAVKVVFDRKGFALYFSRASIPFPRDGMAALPADACWYRHLGIYAYRAGFLRRYTAWEPSPPEILESLEQLRALYEGERIHVAPSCAALPPGVDTPEDLESVRRLVGDQESA